MNIFQNVKNPNIPRNTFDLSHDLKMTCDFGELVPLGVFETYPGDLWKINAQVLSRTLAMISPVMHLVEIDIHFYKIPIRILYDDFDDIIAPPDPDDTPPLAPTISQVYLIEEGDLGDHLGLPIDANIATDTDLLVVAYPIAAYAKIYDYWYRDQNLQAVVTEDLNAGNNNSWARTMMKNPVLKRAWNHDYFTSNLPYAQKGDIVTLPVATAGVDVVAKTDYPLDQSQVRQTIDGGLGSGLVDLQTSGGTPGAQGDFLSGGGLAFYDPNGTLEVDLQAAATDIITVRTAFKIQEFLEMDSRAGTRYKEVVYAHFDVNTNDGRLNEPEYIGGQKSNIKISEVLSTAQTREYNSDTIINPVGEMSGHGISFDNGKQISTYCREHGYIMPIFSARPRTSYQQGVHKLWNRKERLDYPWPSLAHIGEQPVYVQELYTALADPTKLLTVFGYIPRYSELKFLPSRNAGLMRTDFKHWHLGRIFSSEPALNSDFIECSPDKRIFAVTTEPALLNHIIFNISCQRNFPMFSTPKL